MVEKQFDEEKANVVVDFKIHDYLFDQTGSYNTQYIQVMNRHYFIDKSIPDIPNSNMTVMKWNELKYILF